jgi:predicted aspartyl protease
VSPSYSSKFPDEPPGPYVTVQISSPVTNESREIQGILDTGADHTLIPNPTAVALKLRQISEIDILDVNGGKTTQSTYVANLAFNGLEFPTVEVAGAPYAIVLIGRDILEQLVVTFDGPNQTFTLSKP